MSAASQIVYSATAYMFGLHTIAFLDSIGVLTEGPVRNIDVVYCVDGKNVSKQFVGVVRLLLS